LTTVPRKRIAQINELLRHEIGTYLARHYEPPRGCVVTIEEVRTSADISAAKILTSVLPYERTDEVVEHLNASRHDLMHHTIDRLKFKKVPVITFVPDDREERAAHIGDLLDASS